MSDKPKEIVILNIYEWEGYLLFVDNACIGHYDDVGEMSLEDYTPIGNIIRHAISEEQYEASRKIGDSMVFAEMSIKDILAGVVPVDQYS